MTKDAVTVQRYDGVALVSLPAGGAPAASALSLADALDALADDEQVRAVVLALSGGVGDGEENDGERGPLGPRLRGDDEDESHGLSVRGDDEKSGAAAVAAFPKPTIAAVDGECLDRALELVLACDIRVAGPGARFGMRQVRQGRLPLDGGTQRLARLVGRAHALRLLLTGDVIDAGEALRIGLVQLLGGAGDAIALAQRIAEAAPIASAYAKESVLAGLDMPLAQGLRLEADLSVLLQSTGDRAEGLRSFRERRSPRYEGR